MGKAGMKRIIVGISGASGAIYGIRMLQILRELGSAESHLVMSRQFSDLTAELSSAVEANCQVEGPDQCCAWARFWTPTDVKRASANEYQRFKLTIDGQENLR
jgi:3-polyprenyl-4-hydroxybenzoate decarboxylase